MFTGIVSHVGTIRSVRDGAQRELEIVPGFPLGDLELGASVCHSGVCLTVTEKTADSFRVQVSPETLDRTTLGQWRQGDGVNLERSLRLGDELGGHLVFGHADAVGEMLAATPAGDAFVLRFSLPESLAPMVAVKGSIAVDGVSLTVTGTGDGWFEVALIPHTWNHTTLRDRRPGDRVNLEADMLARYVARQLAHRSPGDGRA
ncbi:riboflavin synthase [Geminicoccaceae bacterium 1502E]|nr:riboflavin synthase [Geminicoccaceae bacterium 1502E]